MTLSDFVPKGCVAVQDIGEATHFIILKDGELTETAHGQGWTNPTSIGSAKHDSVATYLDTGDKRHVICLNEKNQLQNYEYDADEGEWVAGNLHKLNLTVNPKTTISATYGNNKGHIYFQNPSSKIQEVVLEDGNWKASNVFSANHLEFGARLASAVVQDTAYLFYTHPDHSVHQVFVKDDEWHDSILDGTDDGLVKLSIAAGAGNNSFALKYVNIKQECFLYAGGKSAKLGHVTRDGFRPVSNAQGWEFKARGDIDIKNRNSSHITNQPVKVGVGFNGDLSLVKVSVPVNTISSQEGDIGQGLGDNFVRF